MRRVLVKIIGTDHTDSVAYKDSKEINEPLVCEVAFEGLHNNLKIFVKDEPGENYLIYWNYELISEIRSDWLSFVYKGIRVIGSFCDSYPQTITYQIPEHGTYKVIDRGDIKLIYKGKEHVGNISFGGDLLGWFYQMWKTKRIFFNNWHGFEYDENKVDHVIAASVFMNVYSK